MYLFAGYTYLEHYYRNFKPLSRLLILIYIVKKLLAPYIVAKCLNKSYGDTNEKNIYFPIKLFSNDNIINLNIQF